MFVEVMHAYFRGEKLEALWFIVPIGVLLLGFAVLAIKVERPAFAWGVGAPCILIGVVLLAVGVTVGTRTSSQVAELERAYRKDPQAMVAKELPRMRQVNDAFALYVRAYAVLALIGLGLRFGVTADWAHGLGSALVLIAGLGFMIDGFAERRARPYTAALEALKAEPDPR